MSKVRIPDSKSLDLKELLSYVESLGGTSVPSDSASLKFTITTKDELLRHHLIIEVCRKLDTLNIAYEVLE